AKEIACPSSAVLENLLLGNVSAEDLGELSAHLEGCSFCQGQAQTLEVHDALVALACADGHAARDMCARVPRTLLEKVRLLGTWGAPASDGATAAPAGESRPRASART